MKPFLFVILLLSSCTHRVALSPDNLIKQIADYQESGEIQAVYKGKEILVTKEMKPKIFLKTNRECPFWTGIISGCDSDLVGSSLEEIKVNKDTFSLNAFSPGKILPILHRVTLQEVEILEVELSIDHVPDNWTPTWAFGLTIGGPAQFIGYQLHWFPIDALGFDAAVALIPHHSILAGGGFRIRPFRFDNVLPFAGVATSWSLVGAVVEGDIVRSKRTRFLVGPRVGVDFEFFNRHFLLGVEFDLFYDIAKEGFIYDLENERSSDWKPYGGINFAYQF